MDPEGMDPGERITGTRDEHYDLISAAYHALQGAEACDTYALDAEAAGRAELAEFFRETQVVYAGVAERAKALLGNVLGVAGTPLGVAPEDVTLPEEGVAVGEEILAATAPEAPEASISPEDLDATISALRGGVANLTTERALAEIDGWQLKLRESGDPELLPIAENLSRLSDLLSAERKDAEAVGDLLKTLGGQVQRVADRGLGEAGVARMVSERLKTLGGLLASEGDSISG